MKRTGPTNEWTKELITALHKLGVEKEVSLWRMVAHELQRSARAKRVVNLMKLDQHTQENDIVLVPGKLLGNGELTHKVTVAAFSASGSALEKIKQSGSKYIQITELMRTKPDGSGVRVIG